MLTIHATEVNLWRSEPSAGAEITPVDYDGGGMDGEIGLSLHPHGAHHTEAWKPGEPLDGEGRSTQHDTGKLLRDRFCKRKSHRQVLHCGGVS